MDEKDEKIFELEQRINYLECQLFSLVGKLKDNKSLSHEFNFLTKADQDTMLERYIYNFIYPVG